MHPRHAHEQVVVFGEGALAHERGDHGELHQFGELLELLPGAGGEHAPAHVEERLAGAHQKRRRLFDLLGVALERRLVAGQVHRLRVRVGKFAAAHVHRDVHEHGARTSGGGDVERLADDVRDVSRVGHEVVVLGDRDRDAGDVGLLEGIGAEHVARHLAGEDHERYRVHIRVRDAGDRVGRTRAARHDHHARLAGHARVPVGRVRGALLVSREHRADLARVVERVEAGQHHAARVAEYDIDPLCH